MQTNAFKQDKLWGIHDFRVDQFKVALYTKEKSIFEDTYTPVDEVSGTGYTAGGAPLVTTKNGAIENSVAVVSFADVVWPLASITASHAMVYNATKNDRSVCVLDLGGVQQAQAEPFALKFPPDNPNEAFLRET